MTSVARLTPWRVTAVCGRAGGRRKRSSPSTDLGAVTQYFSQHVTGFRAWQHQRSCHTPFHSAHSLPAQAVSVPENAYRKYAAFFQCAIHNFRLQLLGTKKYRRLRRLNFTKYAENRKGDSHSKPNRLLACRSPVANPSVQQIITLSLHLASSF